MIEVKRVRHADPVEFEVTIRQGGSETRHHVTMSQAQHERLANGSCSPEQCIEAAFRFLFDREPKEAILSRFDIDVISRYFPEFEAALPRYIASDRSGRDGP